MNDGRISKRSFRCFRARRDLVERLPLFQNLHAENSGAKKTRKVGKFTVDCHYPLAVLEQAQDQAGFLKRLVREYIEHSVAFH